MLGGDSILGLSLVLFQSNYGLLCRLAEDQNTIYDFCFHEKIYFKFMVRLEADVCVCVSLCVLEGHVDGF